MPRMTAPADHAAEMALFLTQQVVDDPAAVRAELRGHTITLHVAPGEEGRVIGRQGRVIGAIRTLVKAAEGRQQYSIDLSAPRK